MPCAVTAAMISVSPGPIIDRISLRGIVT